MPFESKAQMRAAFGGYLGKEMQNKALQWAHETPNISALPKRKNKFKVPMMQGMKSPKQVA